MRDHHGRLRLVGWSTLVAMAALAAACGTAPLSFIEGHPPMNLLPLNHYPVRVVSVDGRIEFRMPVQVAPGPHMVVLEAVADRSARGSVQRTFAMKVEPCTRYYFIGSRASPMEAGWELVLHSTEKVMSCNPAEEAKQQGSIGSVPSG